MEQEKMKERIREIGALEIELKREKQHLLTLLAEQNCPFSPGDIIEWDGSKWQYKITNIRQGYSVGGYRLHGEKIKKNGEPGVVINEIVLPYDRSKIRVVGK